MPTADVHCAHVCNSVTEIKALSHQGYPLMYELTTESGSQSNEFAIDHSSGVVDLLRILDYEKDPQQYHLKVKVIENGRPTRTSTVNVRIRGFNINFPFLHIFVFKWVQIRVKRRLTMWAWNHRLEFN